MKNYQFKDRICRLYRIRRKHYVEALTISRKLPQKNSHIAIICRRVKEYGFKEAVNLEALTFYNDIKSEFKVELLSVEHVIDKPEVNGDLTFIPFRGLNEYLSIKAPEVLHFYDSAIDDLLNYQFALDNFKVVFTATSTKPFTQGKLSDTVRHGLIHLSDHRNLKVVVHSPYSLRNLVELGISSTVEIAPYVLLKPQNHPKREKSCVGFASSPLTVDAFSSKGVNLLKEIILLNSDLHFLITWRNNSISTNGLESFKNVEVLYGLESMDEFYSKIDCLLVPFVGKNNHATPFSCVEALMCGIPVVVTENVGIASVIRDNNWGSVCKAEKTSLTEGIRAAFCKQEYVQNRTELEDYFSRDKYVKSMKKIYNDLLSSTLSISLNNWNSLLKHYEKDLIIRNDNLKNYYKRDDVVDKYFDIRFGEDKHLKSHKDQVEAIHRSLGQLFHEKRCGLKIIDLATGSGRFIEALLPYGPITLLDSSLAMLNSVKSLVSRQPSKYPIRIVNADIFHLPFKEAFDVVAFFRVLRHLQFDERQKVYEILNNLTNREGVVIVDVPSRTAELAMREYHGWQNYNVYDCLWELSDFVTEIDMFGFKLREAIPIGRHLSEHYKKISGQPVEYLCIISKSYERTSIV